MKTRASGEPEHLDELQGVSEQIASASAGQPAAAETGTGSRQGTPDPLYQQAIESICSVLEAAKRPGHAPQKATIAAADPWLVQTAKEHGLDVDGFLHVIDGSAIRHALKEHGDAARESGRGQLAITDRDFERIPEVIHGYDGIVLGTKNRIGRDQIGYFKRMRDGSTIYIEEIRGGKKELAAVSMRKFSATMDADRLAANLHLNARDDGSGDILILMRNADKDIPGDHAHQSEP
jgi:hypothetical protein